MYSSKKAGFGSSSACRNRSSSCITSSIALTACLLSLSLYTLFVALLVPQGLSFVLRVRPAPVLFECLALLFGEHARRLDQPLRRLARVPLRNQAADVEERL